MEQQQREVEILNARIQDTTLGFDGGIINSFIRLAGKSVGVSLGGYVLHIPDNQQSNYQATGFGMEYIARVLSTVGVNTWEELNGKACRIAIQGNQLLGIGNLIDEVWFYPRLLGDEYQLIAETQAAALALYRENQEAPKELGEDEPKEASAGDEPA